MYVIVDNPDTAAEQLNHDLDQMTKWAKQWLVNFSPKKTKSMVVSLKNETVGHPPLFLDGTQLESVNKYKHLGLMIQDNLKWNDHVHKISIATSKRVNILNHLKYKLDRKTLETLYISYIRPLLEYGDVVWDNCNSALSDCLELIQKRAGRIITGAILRTSTEVLYKELGWTSLKERRKASRLGLLHKIVNDNAPPYLQECLPDTVGNRSRYPLRNRDDIENLNVRLNVYENSFFPRTIVEYNNVDSDIRDSIATENFRMRVLPSMDKPKSWYYIGDRKLSIIHARLRMKCSQLSHDLFSLNIIEQPNCQCGNRFETATHFFLECPLYTACRGEMYQKLNALNFNPTISHILLGNLELDEKINMHAVLIIHDFIKDSERF